MYNVMSIQSVIILGTDVQTYVHTYVYLYMHSDVQCIWESAAPVYFVCVLWSSVRVLVHVQCLCGGGISCVVAVLPNPGMSSHTGHAFVTV